MLGHRLDDPIGLYLPSMYSPISCTFFSPTVIIGIPGARGCFHDGRLGYIDRNEPSTDAR